MNIGLQATLKAAGWASGVRRGSLATTRAGITFEIAEERGGNGQLELRYRYHTATTTADGEVSLPAAASRAQIEDAMTGIYLRVHEKPDASRVFGGGRRDRATANHAEKPATPPETTQATLDL